MDRDSSLIVIFLFLALLFVFQSGGQFNLSALVKEGINFSDREEEFAVPISIEWQGRVIAIMTGGSCMGINGQFGMYKMAFVCLTDLNSSQLFDYSGEVTITGKWLGITCAYKNTIFGECVPDVEIESIK